MVAPVQTIRPFTGEIHSKKRNIFSHFVLVLARVSALLPFVPGVKKCVPGEEVARFSSPALGFFFSPPLSRRRGNKMFMVLEMAGEMETPLTGEPEENRHGRLWPPRPTLATISLHLVCALGGGTFSKTYP